MLDRIVIVGAGRTTQSLLALLANLAPILVLDTAAAALDEISAESPEATPAEGSSRRAHPVTKRLADGTSRFVLEEAREDAGQAVALVAATGDDRKNLETCRLARDLGYRPLLGLVIDPATSSDYEALGARAIVRANILGQVVEHALRYDGLVIATTVGQGKGEIIEFVVLPGSPAIGVPLVDLQAEGWRIAAIYRGGDLVIPIGKMTIEAEDRVLIVGDPVILPGVAEQLRIGMPMFPLRHGKSVVVHLPGGRDRPIEMEAEVLTIRTRATKLVRAYPGAEPAKTIVEDNGVDGASLAPHQRSKVFEDVALEGVDIEDQINHLRRLRPGVVVARGVARPFWARVIGRGGAAASLCNALAAPILFPRGAPHYERVVHALIQGIADAALADAAIDLARMLSLPLVVARVTLPEYLGTRDPRAEQVLVGIERRSRLYGLHAETIELEGNPVEELLRMAHPADLFVVGRKRSMRDSFTSPDIALRLVQSAACSILVKTVEGA